MNDKELIRKYVPLNKQKKAFIKLNKGYPVQYIIGNVEFCDALINVNKNVLIPRFETEMLVEKSIKYLKKMFKHQINIIDLGTGSGCIAIALKKALNANVFAIDISRKALKLARRNAKNNHVKVNFKKGDIGKKPKGKFDCIISNPPYIAYDGFVSYKVKKYEPHIALYALEAGLYFYKIILAYSKDILNRQFLIAFEIDDSLKERLENLLKKEYPKYKYIFEKDLSNLYRYLFIYSE